jgi:predicted DNA binding CopG/RHH family protein
MKRPLPTLRTDAEAERFVADVDLTAHDAASFRRCRFVFAPKPVQLTVRLPQALLDRVKARAVGAGMSVTSYVRRLLERDAKRG